MIRDSRNRTLAPGCGQRSAGSWFVLYMGSCSILLHIVPPPAFVDMATVTEVERRKLITRNKVDCLQCGQPFSGDGSLIPGNQSQLLISLQATWYTRPRALAHRITHLQVAVTKVEAVGMHPGILECFVPLKVVSGQIKTPANAGISQPLQCEVVQNTEVSLSCPGPSSSS